MSNNQDERSQIERAVPKMSKVNCEHCFHGNNS